MESSSVVYCILGWVAHRAGLDKVKEGKEVQLYQGLLLYLFVLHLALMPHTNFHHFSFDLTLFSWLISMYFFFSYVNIVFYLCFHFTPIFFRSN